MPVSAARLTPRTLLLSLLLAACARSQPSVDGATPVQSVGNTTIAKPERPRPYPVEETAGFRKAVETAKEKGKSVLLLVRTPQGGRFLTLKVK